MKSVGLAERMLCQCRNCQWKRRNKQKVLEYARSYRRHNLQSLRKKNLERYYKNQERYRAKHREWVLANPHRVLLLGRKWYVRNKDVVSQRRRDSYHADPMRILVRNADYRARREGADGFYTTEDILRIYRDQKGCCYYCGRFFGGVFTIDHKIPLSRGGSNWPSNLCCACRSCNSSKNNRTPEEFLCHR